VADPARTIEVSRVVDAPAARIFAFLAEPDNHLFLDTSGMVRGSADHRTVRAEGDVFVMNMRNRAKGEHQVENHVVLYEPGRALGWAPAEPGQPPAGHTWVWRLRPLDAHRTLVTQTHDWSAFTHLDMLAHLPVVDRNQLMASLIRLADAVTLET
jgi:uncharacterized protein YndB with AHSA1/START domain